MGADFLEKTQATLKRSWSKQRIRLSEHDLFTQEPVKAARAVLADIVGEESVTQGEQFTFEKVGDQLMGRRGHKHILTVENPPAETLKAVELGCGVALGTVQNVYGDAGVAEISLQ
jgi:hypothetical protein